MTERDTLRQRDRKTERQRETVTDRDRQAEMRERGGEEREMTETQRDDTERERETERDREIERETERDRDTDRQRQTEPRERETERDRDTERDSDRDIESQTDRQTERSGGEGTDKSKGPKTPNTMTPTVFASRQLHLQNVRAVALGDKRAEDGRQHGFTGAGGCLARAPLKIKVEARLPDPHERVLSNGVESEVLAVQCCDVWVASTDS